MKLNIRTLFFGALLLGVIVMALRLFLPYVVTLSIAATAAVIFYPVHRRILRTTKGRRALASLLTVALTAIVIILPLSLLLGQAAREAIDLYGRLAIDPAIFKGDILQTAEDAINRWAPTPVDLNKYVGQAVTLLAQHLSGILAGTVKTFVQLFLGVVAYYYMLKDGEEFVDTMVELSPLADREDRDIQHRLKTAIDSIVRGSLIIATIQGIASGIGLAIFGVPYAFLLGAVAGVAAFIPTLGPSLVLLPAALYLLLSGHVGAGIGMLVWSALAVGLIDNLLHPTLVGRGAKIHPFFTLFSVIGGISGFGIIGFIIGPLIMSLLLVLFEIYRKELPAQA